MLAEPGEVLGFQEQAQNLGRTEGGGKDVMGLVDFRSLDVWSGRVGERVE